MSERITNRKRRIVTATVAAATLLSAGCNHGKDGNGDTAAGREQPTGSSVSYHIGKAVWTPVLKDPRNMTPKDDVCLAMPGATLIPLGGNSAMQYRAPKDLDQSGTPCDDGMTIRMEKTTAIKQTAAYRQYAIDRAAIMAIVHTGKVLSETAATDGWVTLLEPAYEPLDDEELSFGDTCNADGPAKVLGHYKGATIEISQGNQRLPVDCPMGAIYITDPNPLGL